jgi:hypothetical protein
MPRPNRSSRSAFGRARSRLFGAKTERSPMSATDRNPDMEPGERMDNSQKTVLLMLFEDRVPWTLDELGRELKNQLDAADAADAVSALTGAGLVHRLGDFVIPTRAARRSDELYEGAL